MAIKGHCNNRKDVHVDHRLFSPRYDDEGDPKSNWYEWDNLTMCYYAFCDYQSYNAWVVAAGNYIENILTPYYKNILNEAEKHFGGAALPQDLLDRFNQAKKVIDEWRNSNYSPTKTPGDMFFHPTQVYWKGEILDVVDLYDRAACQHYELGLIAENELKRKYLVDKPSSYSVSVPEGGFLGNPAGTESVGSKMSGVGMAVGLVALGAAGYFGFKVLTE